MDAAPAVPRRLAQLADASGAFRAVLCDVWGVVHNGLIAFPAAVDALRAFRQTGGVVLMVTNAPRPRSWVLAQLDDLGVEDNAFDDLISSGDVARTLLGERQGTRIYHLGPDRDLPIYEGLPIDLVSVDQADIVSCTGLFDDETETAEDYDPIFRRMAAARLTMICSNPDLVVERGDRLVPCAGALAERYRVLGGEAVIVGKPHAPIYEQALARINERASANVASEAVLAIGDGAATDIVGADRSGMATLFISSGMRFTDGEPGDFGRPDRVAAYLGQHQTSADYFMPTLK